jgi:heat shock protein HslJ
MMNNPRSILLGAAAGLLSGIVLAGCSVPAEKAAASAPPPSTAPADAGRKTSAAPGAGHPLAGTAWRLLEIQSMDDAVGTIRVEDSSLYTMRLNPDGSVAFRLNCNTATGTWSAEAGPDPASGRLEFGPLAATMALCPPPSVDEQVMTQAPYFRSYLLQGGRLYLSLLADGGIFVWERSAPRD